VLFQAIVSALDTEPPLLCPLAADCHMVKTAIWP
jgi:hypothetical protein